MTASDADDPTYGNSAKIVYSILEGQPYFSVDPKTGKTAAASELASNMLQLLYSERLFSRVTTIDCI